MTIDEVSRQYQIPEKVLKEYETYMTLVLEGAGANDRKMQMLQKKREGILDEIHFREKKIQYLDYLRYEIRRSQ